MWLSWSNFFGLFSKSLVLLGRALGHEVLFGNVKLGLLVEKLLVEQLKIAPGDLLADKHLDPAVLARPQVADEASFALGIAVRETVGVGAGQLPDVVGVVVSDKGAEAALVGGPAGRVGAELDALGVLAVLLGASRPGVHDLVRLGVVLRHDEARVEHELAELVLVVLAVGIDGQGEGVVARVEVPKVQQPLERKVEVLEDGVGIKVQAGLVLLEDGGDDGCLFPRGAAILGLLNGDKVVLIAVDLGCRPTVSVCKELRKSQQARTIEPVVQNTHRQAVDLFCVRLPTHDIGTEDLVGRIKGAVIEIDDAQVVAEGLGEVDAMLKVVLEGAERLVEAGVGRDGRLVDVEPDIAEGGIGNVRLGGLNGLDGLDRLGGFHRIGRGSSLGPRGNGACV